MNTGTRTSDRLDAMMRFVRSHRRGLLLAALTIIGLPLVAVGTLQLFLSHKFGQNERFGTDPRYACTRIDGVPASEDVSVDWPRGQAFVAVQSRFGPKANPAENGIYLVDLRANNRVVNVTPAALTLKPAGISLYVAPNGRRRLFVINGTSSGPVIALFDVAENGTLTLVEQLHSPLVKTPNDLVAVGPRQFYITNSTNMAPGFSAWVALKRILLDLDLTGDVTYFDGKLFQIAASHQPHPNGINVSPDGKQLYVAETYGKRLAIFDRDLVTGRLSGVRRVALPGAADNIAVAPDGAVFVGALPHMLSNLAHVTEGNPTRPPAQIARIYPQLSPPRAARAWSDDGRLITTVTIGAPFAKSPAGYSLLIGSISDRHMLSCVPAGA